MPPYQPSLWDNVALENGYRLLSDLRLKEAIDEFNLAMKSPIGEEESIASALETCRYWQERLLDPLIPGSDKSSLKPNNPSTRGILDSFTAYPFDSKMKGFKNNLLGYITDLFQVQCAWDPNQFETLFDLLLKLEMYPKAESFASHYVEQMPKDIGLLYFLGQAQCLNRNHSQACRNYGRAMLFHPDRNLEHRIVHEGLSSLVQAHGLEKAAVYGRLYDILPYLSLTDGPKIWDERHGHAIQCYELVQKLSDTQYNNEHKANIQYRKQLKEIAPDIFEVYMLRLGHRM